MPLRSLTGIRTTGEPHIGNYLGAIKPALKFQKNRFECFYFLADLHALTSEKNPSNLKKNIYDVVSTWIALGFDYKKNILFRQSDVPYVVELAWYLSCVTGMGFISKAHSYKDAVSKGIEINHGVFYYPILMAADILLYNSNVVPVGKDQKQHVEMARDIAGFFNSTFGRVLTLPEPSIQENVMVIPGLDGRKMSKSYNNTVKIFSSEKELRKKINSITTDSSSLESPKILEGTTIGELLKLFVSTDDYNSLKVDMNKGGLGWGYAKDMLFNAINNELKEPRRVYEQVRADTVLLDQILKDGKERATNVALKTINRVRSAIGLNDE